jgi:hypothetical protein
VTAARTNAPTNVQAGASAAPQGAVNSAGPDGDARCPQALGQPARVAETGSAGVAEARVAHTAHSPDCYRSLVSSENSGSGAMLLLAAGSAEVAEIAALAIAPNERRGTGDARSAVEEENDRFRAELRAELAEQDALWAAYPKEMRELEAAEHAFEDALRWTDAERRRANRRLEWARAQLEKAKERRR